MKFAIRRGWLAVGWLVVALFAPAPHLARAQTPAEQTAADGGLTFPFPGQPSESGPPSDAGGLPGRPSPGSAAERSQSPAAGSDDTPAYTLPAEMKPQADAAMEEFKRQRAEFERAIGDMREVQLRFVNGLDQSEAAKQRYRELRDQAREKMNATYEAALRLFQYVPDKEATQFIATVIQHRLDRDIYSENTAQGAAQLIDAGVNYLFLFQAAARSAVVSGRFELAEDLFSAINEEKLEEVDVRLATQLEDIKQLYAVEHEIRQREQEQDRLPRVRLKTTKGDIVIELFLDNAPSTVAHFIQLVERGFYDGLDWYQVVDDLLALTGDPTGTGRGDSGRRIIDEHDRVDAREAFRGSLVMAKLPEGDTGNFVPNTASSQFAILFLPVPNLTDEQTVFGRVLKGMEVVSSFRRVDPHKEKKKDELVLPPDRILSAEIIRRPESLPEPVYVE